MNEMLTLSEHAVEANGEAAELEAAAAPPAAAAAASGLYEWRRLPGGPFASFTREELRLDVDGFYPQMAASGTGFSGLTSRVHWIARLQRTANGWSGAIFYKNGSTGLLPQTHVAIRRTSLGLQATFSGGGGSTVTRSYKLISRAFHPVELEFDAVTEDATLLSIQTHDHPDRPADLPNETLSIAEVYRRSGFAVTRSGGDSLVPISSAGTDAVWSDAEMHDAMQTHWSRFVNRPLWSLWTFFADRHESGTSLGGIMFDDIGPNHRQGTALFLESFIAQAPPGDPAPEAWVRRMVFWTAVHEMGHAFNLAHSWQKALGTAWVPLAPDDEARSFMNYPFFVSGGVPEFFKSFYFRFSDQELLFLRHAPERFVQMGNAAWFDNHGFSQAETNTHAGLKLELRVNRDRATFEYLEPVVVEMKLTNSGEEPRLIPENLLRTLDHFTFVVKKRGQDARQFQPMARYCWRGKKQTLEPGESLYDNVFLSAGSGGWLIDDPGVYTLQACLSLDNLDVVSSPLELRVLPPFARDEEVLAQDYFTEDVGRIYAFDGSRFLDTGNAALEELAARLPERKAAIHARVALGMGLLKPFKRIIYGETARQARPSLEVSPAKEQGMEYLEEALGRDAATANQAAETLSHIDFRFYSEKLAARQLAEGARDLAVKSQERLVSTLSNRRVKGRKVAEAVLEEVKRRQQELAGGDEDNRGASRGRSRR